MSESILYYGVIPAIKAVVIVLVLGCLLAAKRVYEARRAVADAGLPSAAQPA